MKTIPVKAEAPADPETPETIETPETPADKRLDEIEQRIEELASRVAAIEAKCNESEKATAASLAAIRAAMLPNATKVTAPEAPAAEGSTLRARANALKGTERAAFVAAHAAELIAEAANANR